MAHMYCRAYRLGVCHAEGRLILQERDPFRWAFVAPEQFDVLIVGAGIVGAACALELATAGLHVAVIERDVVGSGATAAGMGHIVVMDEREAQLLLTHYSQRLWDALVAAAPEQHEYLRAARSGWLPTTRRWMP